ncbi:MAG: AAA domain-containing protein, partial [Fimbriimonadaceae bacterium]
EDSSEARQAPIVLLPVLLERKNDGSFQLKWDEAEPGENLSIAAKVKSDFGIELPGFPEELDFKKLFDKFEKAIKGQPRWSVQRDSIALAFFSYAKYLMYIDLDGEKWPEGNKPCEDPTLGSILGDGFTEDGVGLSEDAHLDDLTTPEEAQEVYDSDSSQTLAILEAKSGRSMVIEGPPGTGKSQTITNLIAELVGEGKRVLFVAEKAAALDVVFRRLKLAHLEDACLELHSHKANKRAFYDELNRTVSIAKPKAQQAASDLKQLKESRDTLNAYAEAVNTVVPGRDITPRRAMGELIRIGPEHPKEKRHGFESMNEWRQEEFEDSARIVEKLQAHIAQMGSPKSHPYFGCQLQYLLPQDKTDLGRMLQEAEEKVEALNTSATELARALEVELPTLPSDVERLRRCADFVSRAPKTRGMKLRKVDWQALAQKLDPILKRGERYAAACQELESLGLQGSLNLDVRPLLAALQMEGLVQSPPSEVPDRTPLLNTLQQAFEQAVTAHDQAKKLADLVGLPSPSTLHEVETLSKLGKTLSSAPDLQDVAVADPTWEQGQSVLQEAVNAAKTVQGTKASFGRSLTQAAWKARATDERLILEEHGGKFLKFLNGSYRRAMKQTAELFQEAPKDPLQRVAALRAIEDQQAALGVLTKHRPKCTALLGNKWKSEETDVEAALAIINWVMDAHIRVKAGKLPEPCLEALEKGADPAAIGNLANGLKTSSGSTRSAIDHLAKQLSDAGATLKEHDDWPTFVYLWLNERLRPLMPAMHKAVGESVRKGFNETDRLLNLIARTQKDAGEIGSAEESTAALGDHWQGASTNWGKCRTVIDWARELHKEVKSGNLPEGLLGFFENDGGREGLNEAVSRAQEDRESARIAVQAVLEKAELHDDPSQFTEEPIQRQREKLNRWLERLDDIDQIIQYNQITHDAANAGLDQTVELAEEGIDVDQWLLRSLQRAWYTGVMLEAVSQHNALRTFNRGHHEDVVKKFRELDNKLLKYNRVKVATKHWENVPRGDAGGALGSLQLEFAKKRRHKPIRWAIQNSGAAIQAIKPVFLMSPLSVAMY